MNHTTKTRLLAAVPLASLALVMSACGGDEASADAAESNEIVESGSWDEIVERANEEGAVTYYSAQNQPNIEALEVAFEAEYPDIDFTFVRGLPQDLVPRLELEFSSGKGEADVYTTADAEWSPAAQDAGHLVGVKGPTFTAGEYDADAYLEDTYFASHAATVGLGWNTDLYPDGLESYEDLLDPALGGGKIGIAEASNTALTDFFVYLDETQGEDFKEKLAAQEPRIYPGGQAIVEAMSSGEIAATAYGSPLIEDAMAQGAPLDWTTVTPAWGAMFYTQVLKTAPHPAAAQVLADFMLSDAGQAALAKGAVATMPDIEVSLLPIDDLRLQDTEKLTPEFVTDYQARWRELFQ